MFINGQIFEYGMKILPNVNVEVVGENKFAIANGNGVFNIVAASENSVLKFSRTGYDYDTISVGEFQRNGSYIELYPSTTEIGEAVVQNDYKEKSNLLAWVLGSIAVAAIIALVVKKQPVKVTA